ncbi:MAG: thiosulfate oxidation carrier protein SoxY [Polaromonas sp.]
MQTRRETLKQSALVAGLLAATGLFPQLARAYDGRAAFDAKSTADVVKALSASAPVESKDISLTAPDIAENGAVVPVGASTTLAGVKQLLILVEKNPTALTAMFNVTDSVEPNFSTRVKMGQSSDIYAVAIMKDGKAFYAKKEVKVTLGGCGG